MSCIPSDFPEIGAIAKNSSESVTAASTTTTTTTVENPKKKPTRTRRKKKDGNHSFPNRMRESSEKVGNVLVTEHEDGSSICEQFQINKPDGTPDPRYCTVILEPLNEPENTQLTPIEKNVPKTPPQSTPGFKFTARTPDGGTAMYSHRFVTLTHNGQRSELHFISPHKKNDDIKNDPKNKMSGKTRINEDIENNQENETETPNETKRMKRRLSFSAEEEPTYTKGGTEVLLTGYKRVRSEWPSQNSVMERSAREALSDFIEKNKEFCDEKMISLLTTIMQEFKAEWLHCLGFALCPKDYPPQCPSNLGVGGSWFNTWMLILEDVARHFRSFCPEPGAVKVTPKFEMLLGSNIVSKIFYRIEIKKDKNIDTIEGWIDALQLPNQSNFPPRTDGVQLVQVVKARLSNTKPTQVTCFSSKLLSECSRLPRL